VPNIIAVVEPVVAELVEASKRPQKKANEDGGFDRLNHHDKVAGVCLTLLRSLSLWLLSLSKHRSIETTTEKS